MNFRTLMSLIVLLVLTVGATEAQSRSRLHTILESGLLRVGTTGDWNPMSIKDPATNSYKGFDIDVMTALAQDMGVKITFVPTDWKTLVNGIVADKYDISTSASITPARIRTVGFTHSYYQVNTVPVTLKSKLSRFNEWEDIDKPDVIVAVTVDVPDSEPVADQALGIDDLGLELQLDPGGEGGKGGSRPEEGAVPESAKECGKTGRGLHDASGRGSRLRVRG